MITLGYNSIYRGYNRRYPFVRHLLGVITPFITGRGPPSSQLASWKGASVLEHISGNDAVKSFDQVQFVSMFSCVFVCVCLLDVFVSSVHGLVRRIRN